MDSRPASIPPEELLAEAGFLRRLARELVSDPDLSADLVQATFAVALEHPPRRPGPIRGWLATVAANLARNARRGELRRSQREESAARPERCETGELAIEKLEIQRVLFESLLALSEPQRTTLYLRYYEGLAPSAIAARLGVPVKTVKTRHTRALAELRERLDERSGGERRVWLEALVPLAVPRAAGGSVVGLKAAAIAQAIGGIAMKKAAVAVLLVLCGWLVWRTALGIESRSVKGAADVASPLPAIATDAESAQARSVVDPALEPSVSRRAAESDGATPAETGELKVQLTWSDDTPAAGVGLDLRCENDPAPREERFRARTDASGSALVPGLFPGPVRIGLDRGARFDAEVKAGETRTIVFTVPRGHDVAGRVVDELGEPVGGAEIWCEGRSIGWGEPNGKPIALSASDGAFRLRDLSGDASFGARASGHVASVVFQPGSLPVGPDGARTVTLELGAAGGRVEGRVLDPEGRPLAGALVQAGPRGGHIVDLPSGLRGEAPRPAVVETGPDGSFALPGELEPGSQPVHAVARGFPIWSGSVDVALGATARIEIRMQLPASIAGSVLDHALAPVAGAGVRCGEEWQGGWFFDPFPPPRATTDADGRFVLDWVAPGAQEIGAVAPESRARLGKARGTVACRAGEQSRVELVLDPAPAIGGRVVDARGAALAGWNVFAESIPYGRSYPRHDVTDAEGRFLLANVGADCRHKVAVCGPHEFPNPPRAEVEALPGDELEIVVERTELALGFVRGELRDRDGSVPADVELVLQPEGESGAPFVDFDAASGAFEHGPILRGRYALRAIRGGRTLVQTEWFDVADEPLDVGTVWIEEPGSVELTVQGLPAELLSKLRFSLDRENQGTRYFEPVDGRLLCTELAPGTWKVSLAERELFVRAAEVEVVSGETARAEVKVERAFRVVLTAAFPDGAPPWHDFWIDARDEQGALLQSQHWFPAYFQTPDTEIVLHLPAGSARIEARTDTGLAAAATVEVRPRAPSIPLALR